MLDRLSPAGDPVAKALDRRAAPVARRHVPGQERVTRADPGACLLLFDRDPVERWPLVLHVCVAAVADRHDRLAGAQPRYLDDRLRPILDVVELLADELL